MTNQRRPRCLIFGMIGLLLVGRAGPAQTATGTGPVWAPDAALADRLGINTAVGDYLVHPPKGFRLVSQPAGRAQVWEWQGAAVPGAIVPGFRVRIDPAAPGETAVQALGAQLRALHQGRQDWRQSAPEQGYVGGILFQRAQWKGAEALPSGRRIVEGAAYVALDGPRLIRLSSQAGESAGRSVLPLLEAATRTFHRLDPEQVELSEMPRGSGTPVAPSPSPPAAPTPSPAAAPGPNPSAAPGPSPAAAPGTMDQLEPEVQVLSYIIRPPKDYVLFRITVPGRFSPPVFTWRGPRHPNGTRPTLAISFTGVPTAGTPGGPANAALLNLLKTLTHQFQDISVSPFQRGLVGTIPASRMTWHGSMPGTRPAVITQGFAYAVQDGPQMVVFFAADAVPYDTTTLSVLDAAVMTFHK